MSEPWRSRIVGSGTEAPDQLLANPRNWRIHPKAQQDALAGVLTEIGWVQNVIVNQRTGHVVDGHARVEIAISRGEASVPVVYVDLDENEEGVILAALDPLAGMAVTDPEKWAELLSEITVSDAALQAMFAAGKPKEGLTEPDDVPAIPDEPISKLGDLWLLGEHRLLCGDSTKAEDVGRLMAGDQAAAIVTSPPYGVGMEYEGAPDQAATTALLEAAFAQWTAIVASDRFAFVNFGERYVWLEPMVGVYHRLFTGLGWRWYDQRFWRRSQVGMAIWNTTQPRAMSQIEYLFTFQKGTANFPVNDLAISKEQLWEATGSSAGKGHPAVMAEGIAENAVAIYTHAGEIVAEPFAGAGTTLIACERLGRRCYAMEIEPKYVDVAVKRWEQFTGQSAVRESAASTNGTTRGRSKSSQPIRGSTGKTKASVK